MCSGHIGRNRRRPMGFFGPFNKWWSDYFLQHGRRPSKADISLWRAENPNWRPELTIEDIVQHSKGRRDPEKNRLYFVEYRRKMKGIAKKAVRKAVRRRPRAAEQDEDEVDEGDEDDADDDGLDDHCTMLPADGVSPLPCNDAEQEGKSIGNKGSRRSYVQEPRTHASSHRGTQPAPSRSAPGRARHADVAPPPPPLPSTQAPDVRCNVRRGSDDSSPTSSLCDNAASAGAATGSTQPGSASPASPEDFSEQQTAITRRLNLILGAPSDPCDAVGHPVRIQVRRSRGPAISRQQRNANGGLGGSAGGAGRSVATQPDIHCPSLNSGRAAEPGEVDPTDVAGVAAASLHVQQQKQRQHGNGGSSGEPVHAACDEWGAANGGAAAAAAASPPQPALCDNWAAGHALLRKHQAAAATEGPDTVIDAAWWSNDGPEWPCEPPEGLPLAAWGLVEERAVSPASCPWPPVPCSHVAAGAAPEEAVAPKPEPGAQDARAQAPKNTNAAECRTHVLAPAAVPQAAAAASSALRIPPSGGRHPHSHPRILLRTCNTSSISGMCARREGGAAAALPRLPPLSAKAKASARGAQPVLAPAKRPAADAGGQQRSSSSAIGGGGCGASDPQAMGSGCGGSSDDSSAASAAGTNCAVRKMEDGPGTAAVAAAASAPAKRPRVGSAVADQPVAPALQSLHRQPWEYQQQPHGLGTGPEGVSRGPSPAESSSPCHPAYPMQYAAGFGGAQSRTRPLSYDGTHEFFQGPAWPTAAGGQVAIKSEAAGAGSGTTGVGPVAADGDVTGRAAVPYPASQPHHYHHHQQRQQQCHQQYQQQYQQQCHQHQQGCSGRRLRGPSGACWFEGTDLGLDLDDVDPSWLESLLTDPEPLDEDGLWALLQEEESGLEAERGGEGLLPEPWPQPQQAGKGHGDGGAAAPRLACPPADTFCIATWTDAPGCL